MFVIEVAAWADSSCRNVSLPASSAASDWKGLNSKMSTKEKPLIAIVGATSKQGRSVAATLLRSERFRVRALTRKKDSAAALSLEKLGAEIVTVPLEPGFQKDLIAAFKGADGAFLMTPPIAPPQTTEAPLGRELADAAVEARALLRKLRAYAAPSSEWCTRSPEADQRRQAPAFRCQAAIRNWQPGSWRCRNERRRSSCIASR